MKQSSSYNSPVRLVYPDGRVDLRPSPTEVYEALSDAQQAAEATRVVLERDEERYMRLTHIAETGFTVEVRDGSDQRHFRSQIESLTIKISASLMLSYLAEEADWENMIQWRPYTSLSVRQPSVRRKRRARLIEKRGKQVFISKHWALIVYGVLCYGASAMIFLFTPSTPVQILYVMDLENLIAMGTASLILSNFVDD